MSISTSSIASSANVRDGLSMVMAKKALDQMRTEGRQAAELVQSAASVGRSQPAASSGVVSGGRVDLYA